MSKDLATCCKVIVIVSDPNTALVFNMDSNRKHFLCVEDLTVSEAATMCKKMSPPIPATAEELSRVFNQLGTRPSMLIELHEHLLEEEVFIAVITSCLLVVVNFIYFDLVIGCTAQLVAFKHQKLLCAIQKKPNGLPVEDVSDVYCNGVRLSDPLSVAPAIKVSEAVLYNIERGKYFLQSRMYATALAVMEFGTVAAKNVATSTEEDCKK